MQKQISPVLYFFKGALHYKWTAMVISWVLCLGGWVYVSEMPNNYTSEAKVQIRYQPMLVNSFSLEGDHKGLLRVIQQWLFTKENLDQIIDVSGLEKTINGEKEHHALTARLKRDIKITSHNDAMTYIISYEDQSPLVASNVVRAILNIINLQIEYNNNDMRNQTKKLMDDQIKEIELQLKNAETQKLNLNQNTNYDAIKIKLDEQLKLKNEFIVQSQKESAEGEFFKVLIAPTIPLEPSSPNRKLLFSGVFAGSLMIGLTTAFLLFTRPNVIPPWSIKELIEQTKKYIKDNLKFISYALGLVVIYSFLMLVEIFNVHALSLPHLMQSIR